MNTKCAKIQLPQSDQETPAEAGRKSFWTALPRVSLSETTLSDAPFQLLPRAVYSADQLEASLRWQQAYAEAASSELSLSVLVSLRHWDTPAIDVFFESLRPQSFRNFEVLVAASLGSEQWNSARAIIDRLALPVVLLATPGENTESDDLRQLSEACLGAWVVPVVHPGFLHPQALYLLSQRAEQTFADVIFTNEVLVDAQLHPITYVRRPPVDQLSLLGSNLSGESLCLRRETAYECLHANEMRGVAADILPWRFWVWIAQAGLGCERLPLALQLQFARTAGADP
ncbi:MAG: hypothetical protein KDD44_12215, partial [Bdellovibrionales bacterium]|nr:hypothetical protein [Bdellovibrionales bacterium]